MYITADGCGIAATVIPVLLLAGVLARSNLQVQRLAKKIAAIEGRRYRPWGRGAILFAALYSLAGMGIALSGSFTGRGVASWAGLLVVGSIVSASIHMLVTADFEATVDLVAAEAILDERQVQQDRDDDDEGKPE